jgi:WD40 repeat protein
MSTTARRAVLLAALAFSPLAAAPAHAQPAPSYARQIKPLLARYCLECHNAGEPNGGLNLESYQSLREGGKHGPVVKPGKPDESRLVLLPEGKDKPPMPPKKARQPKADEVALLRRWVEGGAKDDTGVPVTLPVIQPKTPAPSPVAALAYRLDGKVLAAGAHREVVLLDPASGAVLARLGGQTGQVTALAFNRDGSLLAAASGSPGTAGEVRLYASAPGALPAEKPAQTLAAHKDLVLDVAFSPDGKTLATCGYDRLIRLWDAETGKPLRDLKDHSDAVYSVRFSPDGKLLASGAADRAVKVWDAASGKRLYTLGEPTDWVYAVAWSPKGNLLAAAGVDKSIRIWEASAEGGKLVHSVFAHEGPVTKLAYSADGGSLYSLSEDRTAKAWDAAKMVEHAVYARQPDTALALAVRPDRKQVAVGRFDGVLALLDEATGKVQAEPLPEKPKPPKLEKLTPASATRGGEVKVKLEGKGLQGAAVETTIPGAQVKAGAAGADAVEVLLTVPPFTPAAAYQVSVKTSAGQAALPFVVDLFPTAEATGAGASPRTGQPVTLPVSIAGSLGKAGAVHYFRFEAKAGQELGVQALTAALGSKLEPVLTLTDADGRTLAESTNGLLGWTFARAGTYSLGIRDREYRGDPAMTYRLHLGDIPIVSAIFPLGVQRGTEVEVRVEGVNLGGVHAVKVKAAPDAALDSRLPVVVATPTGPSLGAPSVVVGEFPETSSSEKGAAMAVPGTANGRLLEEGATATYRFKARKGERLLLEVAARRLGSPLDTTLEILDADGKPLPRATLRCLAKTYIAFRDHDSSSPGIRLEGWSELAVNDYLLVGGELMRIKALPRNPDDDCQFFSAAGQRLGFLGTTPTHHPQGQPMYKAAIHPPGTTFAPNGLPVVTLYHRNDDGGPGFGKDSRLVFDPPADGDYLARVGDARGQSGPDCAFRLTVRPPRPSFRVSFSPTAPVVSKGAAVPITVNAERIDEYDGPIEVKLTDLPPGLSAPATTIPAGENSTSFALFAEADAVTPAAPLLLTASAAIDGRKVSREVKGGKVTAAEPGDLVTTTAQGAVTIKPGGEAKLTVTVERRNGFAGRVPLDVRGLPHGVRVLDVGLNGILITEKETTRTFVLYAEPWVEPTRHPFVVLARREGKNTEHAAKSVLLEVAR